MTPEIQLDYDRYIFATPCKIDCEHAAWVFHFWGNHAIGLWWITVRDMMLHGY